MILTVTLNASIDKFYLVDALRPYEVARVREVNNTAGGKGMNVSRVAALAGEPVTAMGFVGGHNGALFESLIVEPGITKRFTHTAAETRCCINVRDEAAGRSTEFLEPGAPVSPGEVEAFLRDFSRQLPAADVVVLSGSMPQGLPVDFYAVLVRLARQAGKPVLLDTSGPALRAALEGAGDWFGQGRPEYDENLLLEGSGLREVAWLFAPPSGRGMRVYTDMPSLVLFTFAAPRPIHGKNGAVYTGFRSVCLETQFVTNAVNCPAFYAPVFHQGETLRSRTVYEFYTEEADQWK